MCKNKDRIIGLDAVKVFACICVVYMHTFRQIDYTVACHPFIYYLTRCSMPIFFMASGFIQLNRSEVSFKYCLRKMLKMFIVAMAWSTIFVFVFSAIEQRISLRNIIGAIFGWPLQMGRFSVFWYFVTMGILYLILIPIRKIFSSNIGAVVLTAILLCFCVLIDINNFAHIIRGITYFSLSGVPTEFKLWAWLLYFCLGGLIGKFNLHKRLKGFIWFILTVVSGVFAVAYMYYMCYIGTRVINGSVMYESTALILFSCMLFCMFLNVNSRHAAVNKIIIFMGTVQMAVYALHYNLISFFVARWDFSASFMQLVLGAVVICICAAVGYIMLKIPYIKRIMHI